MANIYLLQFNSDKTVKKENKAEIVGNDNGDPILRIEAPFAIDNYGCYIDFERSDGVIVPRKGTTDKETVTVDVDGDPQTWYRYEYVFGNDVTQLKTSEATGTLKCSVVFKDKIETSNEIKMNLVPMDVTQNVSGSDVEIAPSEVVRLDGVDATKLNKDFDTYSTQEVPIPADQEIALWDPPTQSNKSATIATLTETVQARSDILPSYPTTADSGIPDPDRSPGYEGNYGRRALSVEESIYDKENPFTFIVSNVPLTETFASSSIFDVSDYPPGDYLDGIVITNYLKARKSGGNWIFRNHYYKKDSLGVESFIESGLELLISNSSYTNPVQIRDTITTAFIIEPGDTFIIKSSARAENATTVTAYAEIMGIPPTSYSVIGLPGGSVSSNKMNKITGGTIGNIAKIKEDGDMEDADIAATDLALLSAIQTFLAKITIDDDLDVLQDLLVNGSVQVNTNMTIDGDLTVSGTQTILNVTTVDTEDNIIRLASGQTSGLVDIGIEGERGTDTNIFMGWQESTNLFKIGLIGSLKRIATIIDNPNINEIFVYDSATGNLVTKTATEIKTILSLENVDNTSDLDKPISNATQTALTDLDNRKLEVVVVENADTPIGTGKIINATGGASFSQDGVNPDQVNLFVPVGGTGTGKAAIGEATMTVPLALTPITTELPVTFTTKVQSDNTGVFTLDDTNNQIIIDFTNIQDEALKYKTTFKPIFINTTNSNVDIDFITKLDGVEVDRQRQRIPASVSVPDGVDNSNFESIITTNPLQSQQIVTYFLEAPTDLGVSLEDGEFEFQTSFVVGENVQNVMFKDVYDTNQLGKVDSSQSSESTELLLTTNPQDSDLVTIKTGALIPNHIYTVELQATMTSAFLRWSPDNETTYYDIYEEDGVTQAVGTDYTAIDTNQFDVLYDGTKLKIVSLEKRVEDIEKEFVINPVPEIKTASIDHITATPNGGFIDYRTIKGLSLNNLAFIDLVTAYTPGGIGGRIKPDTTTGVMRIQDAYSTTSQTINVITSDKIFIYGLVDTATLSAGVGLIYSDATTQEVNVGVTDELEAYGTITANKTLLANPYLVDNSNAVTTSTTPISFITINKTALGIESFSDAKMLDIVRQGYFEGVKSVDKLMSIKSIGTNLIDKTAVTVDSKINNTTGVVEASVGDNATEFIKIDNLDNYVLSGLTNTTPSGAYYDAQQNYISGFTSYASLTIPTNAIYIRLTIDDLDLDTAQLEKGTVATPYVAHQYQDTTFNFQDDLRSLPNGVQDEATLGQVKRKVSPPYILQSADITQVITGTNLQRVVIPNTAFTGIANLLSAPEGKTIFKGLPETDAGNFDTAGFEGYFAQDNTNTLVLVALETYANLAAAQADLAGTFVQYELAEPTYEPYNETRVNSHTDYETEPNTQLLVENTIVFNEYTAEISQTTKDTSNDNREAINKVSNDVATKTESYQELNYELLVANWSVSPISGGDFDGYYSYDITDEDIVSTDIAKVWSTTPSKTNYDNAIFAPENETFEDTLTVYALIKPTSSIFINYIITKGVS